MVLLGSSISHYELIQIRHFKLPEKKKKRCHIKTTLSPYCDLCVTGSLSVTGWAIKERDEDMFPCCFPLLKKKIEESTGISLNTKPSPVFSLILFSEHLLPISCLLCWWRWNGNQIWVPELSRFIIHTVAKQIFSLCHRCYFHKALFWFPPFPFIVK